MSKTTDKKKSKQELEEMRLPEIVNWMIDDWLKDPRLGKLGEEQYRPYVKYGEAVWRESN